MIKSRKMRWMGHVPCTGEMKEAHKTLVRKPKRKRAHRTSTHTQEDNIRMDLREMVGKCGVESSDLR
jgi:hypothetical protein